MMKNKGIVALSVVILSGGIILEISIALALITFFLLQSGFGARFSFEALITAQSGVNDALMKIVRNKDFQTGGIPYILTIDSRHQAEITVCRESKTVNTSCDTPNFGKTEITSRGKTFNKNRVVRSYVNINQTTGEIQAEFTEEIAL
ncbi:MAG: hypothetical protein QMD86_02555 [Patescibacteria group bacterium]|nr:hypothetical protein [Patescibacteria group bacterium]